MAPASDLPLALWQANLDLQMRIARLLQDNGREWLDMGLRAVGEGAVEFDAESRALWRSGDWQALAALPVETLWRQLEQRVGDGQALAQVALSAQDAFAGGVASALQDWQATVTRALSDAGVGTAGVGLSPFDAWQEALAPWREALSQLQASVAAVAPAMATAAAAAPGRKPAPAAAPREPAARKPAAKKKAAAKARPKGPHKRGG